MHMGANTNVQWRNRAEPEKVWLVVSDPTEIDAKDLSERVTLDISEADYVFLRTFAKYRNALAKAQKKKLVRQWSRKSFAEALMRDQCNALRKQIEQMVDALGPLPDGDDKKGMQRYAERVVAWSKKQTK